MKKIYTMPIERALTEEEVKARGKELDAQLSKIDNAEAAKKAYNEKIKNEITAIKLVIESIRTQIQTGKQAFPVEVYNDYNYRTGYVYARRVDNDSVVSSRELSMSERQIDLFDSKLPEPSAAQINSLRTMANGETEEN